MKQRLNPRLDVLPVAQREIWPSLAPAAQSSFVLYGGTAVALHLGHRVSIDFDFFRSDRLDKDRLRRDFEFVEAATILQDMPDTLVVLAEMPSGPVKVSFFGGMSFGRVNDPFDTDDGNLLVASREDLLATKLKATLDRAEAKDYRDIARLISAGVALPVGLSACQMFHGEPAQVLRAIGFFQDGDLPTLGADDRQVLLTARNQVRQLPEVHLQSGLVVSTAEDSR
jgi:hypothetical protein